MINYFKMKDLDGLEIEDLIGKPPIPYNELTKYKNVDELLGKENYAIILYLTAPNEGHYVAITANDETGKIRFFDSYGLHFGAEKEYGAGYSNQFGRQIDRLIGQYNPEWNKVDYQSKKSKISTCGRWSSIACKLRNLSLKQIEEFFKGNNDSFLRQDDNIATLLTMLTLNDITSYFKSVSRSK